MKIAQYILHCGLLALACRDPENSASLLEELLNCCAAVNALSSGQIPCSSQNVNDLLDDAKTLLLLRQASLRHNLDFARDGARQYLAFPRASAFQRATAEQNPTATVNIPNLRLAWSATEPRH